MSELTNDIAFRLRLQHGVFRATVGVNQTVIIDTLYSEAADEIERLRALLRHGLTQGYDCKGCDLCTELKAIHEDALRDA